MKKTVIVCTTFTVVLSVAVELTIGEPPKHVERPDYSTPYAVGRGVEMAATTASSSSGPLFSILLSPDFTKRA